MRDNSRFLTIPEAAAELRISRGVCYRLAREGRLGAVRLGPRRLVIARAALDRLAAGGLGSGGEAPACDEP